MHRVHKSFVRPEVKFTSSEVAAISGAIVVADGPYIMIVVVCPWVSWECLYSFATHQSFIIAIVAAALIL